MTVYAHWAAPGGSQTSTRISTSPWPAIGRAAGHGAVAPGVDDHLDRLVARRQRPARARLDERERLPVAVQVDPDGLDAREVVADEDRPVARGHVVERCEGVDRRVHLPDRRDVADELPLERGGDLRDGARATPAAPPRPGPGGWAASCPRPPRRPVPARPRWPRCGASSAIPSSAKRSRTSSSRSSRLLEPALGGGHRGLGDEAGSGAQPKLSRAAGVLGERERPAPRGSVIAGAPPSRNGASARGQVVRGVEGPLAVPPLEVEHGRVAAIEAAGLVDDLGR